MLLFKENCLGAGDIYNEEEASAAILGSLFLRGLVLCFDLYFLRSSSNRYFGNWLFYR